MLLAALLVVACGEDRLYTGPIEVPETIAIGDGEYTAFAARVYEGSRAPMHVTSLDARCEAKTICRVVIKEAKVYVFGVGSGTTTLTLDMTHPITGRHRLRNVVVSVATPGSAPTMSIGSDARPNVGERYELDLDGKKHRCATLGPNRTGALVLSCAAPRKLDGRAFVYEQSDGQITNLVSSVRVCAAPEAGPLATLIAYQPINKVIGAPSSACPQP